MYRLQKQSNGGNKIRIDLGCGIRKRTDGDWIGVDTIKFPGVDIVDNAIHYLHSLKSNTVEQINMSHFIEHIKASERPELMNECYRVLIPGGKIEVTAPSWSHERAYGDPTHEWPPITTWTFLYMNKAWREINGPHVGYTCNFDWNVSGMHDPNDPWINFRNIETKSIMMSRNINTTTDIYAILTKIKEL